MGDVSQRLFSVSLTSDAEADAHGVWTGEDMGAADEDGADEEPRRGRGEQEGPSIEEIPDTIPDIKSMPLADYEWLVDDTKKMGEGRYCYLCFTANEADNDWLVHINSLVARFDSHEPRVLCNLISTLYYDHIQFAGETPKEDWPPEEVYRHITRHAPSSRALARDAVDLTTRALDMYLRVARRVDHTGKDVEPSKDVMKTMMTLLSMRQRFVKDLESSARQIAM